MAEYVMKDKVQKRGLSDCFLIDSAATSTEEIGNGVHRGTRRKLKEMNIPCGDHRARQMRRADYEAYDYLIGMDTWNIRNMQRITGKAEGEKIRRLLDFAEAPRDIADPWYTGNFDETYEDVDEGCEALLAYVIEHHLS